MFEEFIGSEITFRQIQNWPGPMTPAGDRKPSIFKAAGTVRETVTTPGANGTYTETTTTKRRQSEAASTLALLKHELRMIDAREPIIQMALSERDIRRDGYPRADAAPAHPGVILSFDAAPGRLVYKCDRFRTWQANLRAIALTLEALRKPERYEVLRAGEQYTGNRLLTAGGQTTTMGIEEAAQYISRHTGFSTEVRAQIRKDLVFRRDPDLLAEMYRRASKNLHPDAGGTAEAMDLLTKARDTMAAHYGLVG